MGVATAEAGIDGAFPRLPPPWARRSAGSTPTTDAIRHVKRVIQFLTIPLCTSIELPAALWLKAKQRAAEERTDLRALIVEGLEHVLARKPKKGGK
jgi:hypothetical protein